MPSFSFIKWFTPAQPLTSWFLDQKKLHFSCIHITCAGFKQTNKKKDNTETGLDSPHRQRVQIGIDRRVQTRRSLNAVSSHVGTRCPSSGEGTSWPAEHPEAASALRLAQLQRVVGTFECTRKSKRAQSQVTGGSGFRLLQLPLWPWHRGEGPDRRPPTAEQQPASRPGLRRPRTAERGRTRFPGLADEHSFLTFLLTKKKKKKRFKVRKVPRKIDVLNLLGPRAFCCVFEWKCF